MKFWYFFDKNCHLVFSGFGFFRISRFAHKISKKCTPSQILLYNQAIQLYKTVNHRDFPCTLEDITLVDQTICTSRQLKFKVFRNNKLKIGLNTTANKLHCISDLIGYDMLNFGFVHFKKLAKIQFLKFGKT